jgi:hypothetical protein
VAYEANDETQSLALIAANPKRGHCELYSGSQTPDKTIITKDTTFHKGFGLRSVP